MKIIHINYSVNRAYIYSSSKKLFTTAQAWKFIEDESNSSSIDGRIFINNRSIREIKDCIKNYLADCNLDNTKITFLITNVVSDERGNDIINYTDSERKYEEELELLLDENVAYDSPGNINVVDVNSFSEFEQEEAPNDSSAIQQEQSDSEKEKDIVKEDFVTEVNKMKEKTNFFMCECRYDKKNIDMCKTCCIDGSCIVQVGDFCTHCENKFSHLCYNCSKKSDIRKFIEKHNINIDEFLNLYYEVQLANADLAEIEENFYNYSQEEFNNAYEISCDLSDKLFNKYYLLYLQDNPYSNYHDDFFTKLYNFWADYNEHQESKK